MVRYLLDGKVDSTFGDNGIKITEFYGLHDRITALALQRDNKIVAAGFTGNGSSWDFALARFHPDGTYR